MKHSERTPGGSILSAALAYAASGWHVFPVRGESDPTDSGCKTPARELTSWAKQSTTDPEVIAAWFAGSNYGIGIDCGKSGLIMLDGDRLADVDPALVPSLDRHGWKIQGNPARASWVFNAPAGKSYGNGVGGWTGGEIRGAGGYFVAPPSFHAVGGTYREISKGDMEMPRPIEALLIQKKTYPSAVPAGGQSSWTGGDPCRRMAAAKDKGISAIKAAANGGRHEAMVSAAMSVGGLSAMGHFGGVSALKEVREAFIASVNGDPGRDARAEFARAIRPLEAKLAGELQEACAGASCGELEALDLPEPQGFQDFWDSTDQLRRIKARAAYSFRNEWALLACVLARVLAEVDWRVRIPGPPVPAPLNLFAALYGGPASGKSSTMALAEEHLEADSPLTTRFVGPGTGEGIIALFGRPPTAAERKAGSEEFVRTAWQAGVQIDEIGQLSGVSARSGSITRPILLSAFSGQMLSIHNAGVDHRRHVERLAYRICVITGVLPASAGGMLEHADEGLPQRFLWAPARPEALKRGPEPASRGFGWVPNIHSKSKTELEDIDSGVIREIRLEPAMRDEVLAAQDRATMTDDAFLGRRAELKVRVACGLAALHGRVDPTRDDWDGAEAVMTVSDRTIALARRETRVAGLQRRKSEAIDQDLVEAAASVEQAARVARAIAKKIREKGGRLSKRDLGRLIAARDRSVADQALDIAVSKGWITVEQGAKPGSRIFSATETEVK